MGIFRYIWNALFGKSNEQEKYKKGGLLEKETKQETSIDKEVQQVQEPPKFADEKPVKKTIGAYNTENADFNATKVCEFKEPLKTFCEPRFYPNSSNVCNPAITPIPNGDDFFVSNELKSKEKRLDAKFESTVKKEKKESKKKSKKMNIGKKTLSEIKEHILENGSLNTYACKQIFKVKSLHNFISALRGQGFVFITERVTVKDDSGQVIDKAVNYTLIDKK
jgi:hypothetical protein